jgi:hypothetical protein
MQFYKIGHQKPDAKNGVPTGVAFRRGGLLFVRDDDRIKLSKCIRILTNNY